MTDRKARDIRHEDFLRLFELSLDMLGMAGFDGKFKVLNRAWETTLGFSREELLAVPYVDFIHPDDLEATYRAAVGLTVAEDVVLFQNRYRCKNGSYRWLEWNATAQVSEGLIYFVSRDISPRKQLECELKESLERMSAAVEEASQKNEALEAEVAERRRAEEALVLQQRAMQAMSAPIIQAWRGVIVLPVMGQVDAARALAMMERLLAEIVATRSTFAILDLTGVDVVDEATADHVLRIARSAALLGNRCLLSGISPGIAQAVVDTGASLGDIQTFGLLQDALRYALKVLDGPGREATRRRARRRG